MRRVDERLADLPMTPVACRRCHAVVGVRKSSPEQTSIQWDAAAMRDCAERPPAVGLRAAELATCAALRESITRAAAAGELPVADPKPVSEVAAQ